MGTYLGDTFRIQATLTDYDDSALTPDSQEVKLYDPSGTERDSDSSPTSEGGGVYYVDLTIAVAGGKGNWKVVWKVTVSSVDKFEEYVFFVDEAP